MGYYSEVMIAVTKKDFKKIEKEQIKIPDNYFWEELYKYDYNENNIDCVFMKWDYIKYYKEYEEIQALEKSLGKVKDGYIFCRFGEETGDIEFRKKSKIPELMKEFEFVKEMIIKLNKELKEEEEDEFE
jgi:hypothetical protein